MEYSWITVRIVTGFVLGGAALALGLGTRDLIRNITAGFYTRKLLQIGRDLEIFGQRGVLKEIMQRMRSEDGEISVSNAIFLDSITKQ